MASGKASAKPFIDLPHIEQLQDLLQFPAVDQDTSIWLALDEAKVRQGIQRFASRQARDAEFGSDIPFAKS
jgi:hypothetical protein